MANEVEKSIHDDDYGDIKSFDDAVALLSEHGIVGKAASDFGSGFVRAEKDEFVGVPFIVVKAMAGVNEKFAGGFTILYVVTTTGRKAILTDGSTGVHQQVSNLMEKGVDVRGLMCEQGLDVSNYEKEIDGKMVAAKTYYISGM